MLYIFFVDVDVVGLWRNFSAGVDAVVVKVAALDGVFFGNCNKFFALHFRVLQQLLQDLHIVLLFSSIDGTVDEICDGEAAHHVEVRCWLPHAINGLIINHCFILRRADPDVGICFIDSKKDAAWVNFK